MLFDMGVAGDFIANLTQRNVDKANAGTFSGRENRFFPREIEISLFGQIDPYARAEVRFEAGEEEAGEIAVHLAEANLTLMTLPFNTQLKMGQMRNRFGLLNQTHEHDRPFIDQPNVLTRFLGDEGLVERGAELTWVAPLPFFLEGLVGIFNGDNETSFGYGKLTQPLVTGRLRTSSSWATRTPSSSGPRWPTVTHPSGDAIPCSASTPSTSTSRRAGSTRCSRCSAR